MVFGIIRGICKNHSGELSKVFLVIILLVAHLDIVDTELNSYEVLEFYAGAARLAKISAALGVKSAAMDILYDEGDNKKKNNAMDMNTSAGFLFLILFIHGICVSIFLLLFDSPESLGLDPRRVPRTLS